MDYEQEAVGFDRLFVSSPVEETSVTDIPILKMCPHLTPRPWGGVRLGTVLGKTLPGGVRIGESWELSDHPDGPSTIAGGPFDGQPFGEILRRHPLEMVGTATAPEKYPLLVKYIDAEEDLSIQVHPDDDETLRAGIPDRGKTECWFILDCKPGAEIIYGLQEGVTRSHLESAIEHKTVEDCVRRVPIVPGSFLFVPPGTVHAILAGTLLCEIQQSSNVTFRLWDWNRKPERPLHLRESLEVIRYESNCTQDPLPLRPVSTEAPLVTLLTDNPYFKVRAVQLPPHSSIRLDTARKGAILNGVGGGGMIHGTPFNSGETLFIPACLPPFLVETGGSFATLLLTESNE